MDNYLVSARKYRPTRFDEVLGQEQVTLTLKNAIKSDKLAQSFLFCGPRGVGKTSCARILAKIINCEQQMPDFEACNQCGSCNSFNESASFNIHELDAASNNSVEDIRSLIEQVRYAPQAGKYKVYIIDEVHMLSQSAFNAFLKTLEEPPPYAVFILATTEKHKIIPTILSRCQVFDFSRITAEMISGHLAEICKKEGLEADPEGLHIIGQKADGSLRDALSMLDRLSSFGNGKITYEAVLENLNLLDHDYYFRMTDALLLQDTATLLNLFDEILGKGFEGDDLLIGLAEHFRNLLVCQDPQTLSLLPVSEALQGRYQVQSQNTPAAYLLNALNVANAAELVYRSSKNPRLHVELCLLKIAYLPQIISMDPPDVNKMKLGEHQKKARESARPSDSSDEASAEPEPEPAADKTTPSSPQPDMPAAAPPPLSQEPLPAPQTTVIPKTDPPAQADSFKLTSLDKLQEQVRAATNTSTEQAEASIEPGNHVKTLDQDAMQQAWKEFSKKLAEQGKMSLFSTMEQIIPEFSPEKGLVIPVDNQLINDQMLNIKADLNRYMEDTLNVQDLSLTVEVRKPDGPAKKKPAYTSSERFEEMAKQNPNLNDLKDKLDLEIEH